MDRRHYKQKGIRKPIGDIEFLFVVQVILGIQEILPLRLGLVGRSGVMVVSMVNDFRMGLLKVVLLPLLVFAAALDVSNERVKNDGVLVVVVVVVGEVESGTELEAAVTSVRGLGRVARDEQEEEKS